MQYFISCVLCWKVHYFIIDISHPLEYSCFSTKGKYRHLFTDTRNSLMPGTDYIRQRRYVTSIVELLWPEIRKCNPTNTPPFFSFLASRGCERRGIWLLMQSILELSLIARFMGPTWGPSGADRSEMGPMLAPWTLLSWALWPFFTVTIIRPITAPTTYT